MSYAEARTEYYEVTEDGVIYEESEHEEDEAESDPLATDSDDPEDAEREAREEVFGASIEDLMAESRRRGKRRRRRRRRGGSAVKKARKSDVPAHLTSAMGGATVAFMMNQFEEAEAALKRIIEEAPSTAAPHRTLGLIYEERGEKDAALEAFIRAAELARNDRELWKRNAKVLEERGDYQRAIYCLTNALRCSRMTDGDALRARGMLYLKGGKFRMAADSFIKLSKLAPSDIGVARLISHSYAEAGDHERTIAPVEAMLIATEQNVPRTNNPDVLTRHEGALAELIQILVETRFKQRKYYDASLHLTRVQSRSAITGRPMTFVQRLMLAVCQHRLGSEKLASSTFIEFMSSPSMVARHRFFLWEVADSCHDCGDYRKAARAYSLLVENEDDASSVRLLLQRSACFKELGRRREAQKDLEAVLQKEPGNVEASLRIVEFLPSVGKSSQTNRRLRTGSRSSQGLVPDADRVLVPRAMRSGMLSASSLERKTALDLLTVANMYYDNRDYSAFLQQIYPPLEAALNLRVVQKRRRISASAKGICDVVNGTAGAVTDIIESLLNKACGSSASNAGTLHEASAGTYSEQWSGKNLPEAEKDRLCMVGSSLMRVLDDERYTSVAERIVFSFWREGDVALAHPMTRLFESLSHLRIKNNAFLRKRMKMLDLATSVAAGDINRAYEYVRAMLLDNPTSSDYCYLFSVVDQNLPITADPPKYRAWRSLKRLLGRTRRSTFLYMIAGNCLTRCASNTSTYTVGLYLQAFRLTPSHPLLCLCVAVQLLYLALSRRVQNRNDMAVSTLSFFDRYCRKRLAGKTGMHLKWLEMETNYNVGRAVQQLGLTDMACEMYAKVLCVEASGRESELPMWGDLRRDAAYNLVQLYRIRGATAQARAIMAKFLTF